MPDTPEPTRWAAPRPVHDMIAGLDEAALRRVIAGLNNEERDVLLAKLIEEANTIPPADPREALLWHVNRERSERFHAWFCKLDAVAMSAAYLRMIAGDDLEEIMGSAAGGAGSSHG